MKRNPKAIAAILILLLISIMTILFCVFRPNTTPGQKTIAIQVVYPEQTTEDYTVTTTGEYLEDAIHDAQGLTVDGSRTKEFGLMILSVNGVEADYTKDGAYWSVLLNETPCNYGVSSQPIQDGETYSLVYTVAGNP